MFLTDLVCPRLAHCVVELQTPGAQLLTNALPAKELLDTLMVKGTRRKQMQLLSSL